MGKIKYGKMSLMKKSDFSPKNVKFRVTMLLSQDTLDKIREEAADKGLPYQTYINSLLTQHVNRRIRLDEDDEFISERISKPRPRSEEKVRPALAAKRVRR